MNLISNSLLGGNPGTFVFHLKPRPVRWAPSPPRGATAGRSVPFLGSVAVTVGTEDPGAAKHLLPSGLRPEEWCEDRSDVLAASLELRGWGTQVAESLSVGPPAAPPAAAPAWAVCRGGCGLGPLPARAWLSSLPLELSDALAARSLLPNLGRIGFCRLISVNNDQYKYPMKDLTKLWKGYCSEESLWCIFLHIITEWNKSASVCFM